jgi:hypothetical protein
MEHPARRTGSVHLLLDAVAEDDIAGCRAQLEARRGRPWSICGCHGHGEEGGTDTAMSRRQRRSSSTSMDKGTARQGCGWPRFGHGEGVVVHGSSWREVMAMNDWRWRRAARARCADDVAVGKVGSELRPRKARVLPLWTWWHHRGRNRSWPWQGDRMWLPRMSKGEKRQEWRRHWGKWRRE